MKYLLTTLVNLLTFVVSVAVSAEPQSGDRALSDILTSNRYALTIEDGKLSGNGAEVVLGEARQSDIFMFGENHGVKEIAELTQLFYSDLSQRQARILVTEIGPATAAETEHLISFE